MVETGQFTTKCKGDRVVALKQHDIILTRSYLER